MPRIPALLLAAALIAPMVPVHADESWAAKDLVQPKDVATDIKSPLLLHVGFPVLYRSVHIPGSVYAGPGARAEGIEELKKAAANQPKDRQIILYCGCCPWDKCPNIRPAFAALRAMGFRNVKAMILPTDFKADWIDHGYPTEKRAG